MSTITISLPERTMVQARQAAEALNRPVEEVLSDMVSAVLPAVEDAPDELQVELVKMTWMDNHELWHIARDTLDAASQAELHHLSEQQATGRLSVAEIERLEALLHAYGRITLLKARAYALLSLRAGKTLLN